MANKTIGDLDYTDVLARGDKIELEQGEAPTNTSGHTTLGDLADWVADEIGGGGGGGGAARRYTIVTEAAAFTATPATHAGLDTYTRAGGNVTFNSAEGYAAGEVYPIRATAALSLAGTGVTLTPPAGGTLALQLGMAVQVVMTSPTAGDVIGQTVPA